ncbi:MAG: hypothetical protein J6Q13_01280 [Clostridia bacterium]|nr:hypothetical protein [Clostridia bacterium]
MKVVYVIDSIGELNNKINLLKTRFGENLFYVVRADLVELFKTYGHTPNAIYYNNLTEIVHSMLARTELEDIVICYASLKFDNNLLNKFLTAIGNKTKVVSLMPKYNTFEQVCNSTYNVYVKSLFKVKDGLVSPKLQFIPQEFLVELLSSHLGNRLFELDPELSKTISVENKEINESMKPKSSALKYNLIAVIVALVITTGLLASIAYLKVNYLIIFMCVILYFLDIILTIIFLCKAKFDKRFLK